MSTTVQIKSKIKVFGKALQVAFDSKEEEVKFKKEVEGEEKEVKEKYAVYDTVVVWDKKNKKQTAIQWSRHQPDGEKEKTNAFSLLPGYEMQIDTIPGLNIKLEQPIRVKFNRLSLTGKDKKARFFPPKKKKKAPKDGSGSAEKPKKEESISFEHMDYDVEIEIWGEKKKFQRSKQKKAKEEKEKAEKAEKAGKPTPIPQSGEQGNSVPATQPDKDIKLDDDGTTWYKLDKSASGVNIQAIGVSFESGKICVLLSASVSLAGFKFGVHGLTAKANPSTMFSEWPDFDIKGLEFGYYSESVSLGAALLKETIKVNDKDVTQFVGAALLEFKKMKLTLYGMGAYAKVEDEDSLFLYFGMNYPLGGPPFFSVQGLAVGLGYNRSLQLDFKDIEKFHLVQIAFGAKSVSEGTAGLMGLAKELSPYIPPSLGNIFLMIGIRFDTFKMVESFALFVIKLKGKFKLQVFGLSKLSIGVPGKKPYVFVEIKIMGDIDPSEGHVKIDGALTSKSYILTKEVKLTGGFAFYVWWAGEHEGDFVLTLGGYHPEFTIPDHYPKPDKLAVTWNVSDKLKVYGEAYFALTPKAIMAGLVVGAVFNSDEITATFEIGMHFLIQWAPFFYDVRVWVSLRIEIKVKVWGYRIDFAISAGARLHIQGPDFYMKGKAYLEIDLWVKTVEFEASIEVGNRPSTKPLEWEEFSKKMLPKEDKRLKINILEGLEDKSSNVEKPEEDILILQPRSIVLDLESAIPVNELNFNDEKVKEDGKFAMGLLEKDDISGSDSVMNVHLQKYDGTAFSNTSDSKKFKTKTIEKKTPVALWGTKKNSSKLSGDSLVDTTHGVKLSMSDNKIGNSLRIDTNTFDDSQRKRDFDDMKNTGTREDFGQQKEVLKTLSDEELNKWLGLDINTPSDSNFYKNKLRSAQYSLV